MGHDRFITAFKLGALSTALLIAGCSSGGGGTSASSSVLTVEGTAAKGIIKGATVQVFSVDSQGNKGTTSIATSTTNGAGSYSLKVPSNVLNFVVEVSTAPGATMADEATGQDLPMPADFKLRNIVALTQGSGAATYTSHISPLTEMVVQTAEKASGGLIAANIAKAKTGVTVALGFDPEKVKPVNSNSADAANASEEEKLQSLTLAALSRLANNSGLGCGQATPAERVACVVEKVAGSATIDGDNLQLTNAVSSEVRTALTEVAADETINKTGKPTVEGTAAFANDTVPASDGAVTAIEAAKNLFASLRTTRKALSNAGQTGALDVRASAMEADISSAIAPLDEELVNWMRTIPFAIDYFARYKAGEVYYLTLPVYLGGYMPAGECSIHSDTLGTASVSSTTSDNAASVACRISSRIISEEIVNNVRTVKRIDKSIVLVPASGKENAYTYAARSRLITETFSDTAYAPGQVVTSTLGKYGPSFTDSDRATGTIEYTKSGSLLTSLNISGMMPARIDESGNVITDNELWNVQYLRTDEGNNLFKYALSGDFTSQKYDNGNFAEVGKIAVDSGSFVRIQEDGAGNMAENGLKDFSLLVSGGSGGSKIAGSLTLGSAMADKNGLNYLPTKITFTGSLAAQGAEFFKGSVSYQGLGYDAFDTTLPISATNFIKHAVAVTGKIIIPERPDLSVTISATNETYDTASLIGQYNDGTTVLNVSATGSKDETTPPVITISSSDGVSLKFTPSSEIGEVMKDDVKVAVFNHATGMVNYVDGSFESLK